MPLRDLGEWSALLRPLLLAPAFSALCARVDRAYAETTVYPPREQLFSAFLLTPPDRVRVVILGQDPYHGAGQANGLAFSVCPGVKLPPSLRNIFAELHEDTGAPIPQSGDLRVWAEQGVFLLNTVLTVEAGRANSHRDLGWQAFTDGVVDAMAALPQPISFWLWGAQAQKKRARIAASPHPRQILCSPHPSPLSSYRGFFGSRPFSAANTFLQENGEPPIRW